MKAKVDVIAKYKMAISGIEIRVFVYLSCFVTLKTYRMSLSRSVLQKFSLPNTI